MSATAATLPTAAATARAGRCFALAFALLAAVVWSFAYLAVDWRQLFSAESMRLMAQVRRASSSRPTSPRRSCVKAAWGALQTFAVAAIGTLLAVGAARLLALPAAGPLRPRAAARGAASRSTCCAACPSWCGRR